MIFAHLIRWSRVLAVGALTVGSQFASAATFDVVQEPGKQWKSIYVEGTIRENDSKLFVLYVMTDRAILNVNLNSRGGDVEEAIRLGDAIKAFRLATRVPKGSYCASACFMLWLSGSSRSTYFDRSLNAQNLGLHRPYLSSPQNSERSLAAQEAGTLSVRRYLEKKSVPIRLIDTMMSRASNAIYWVNDDDIDELGSVPRDLQELYLAKCGADYQDLYARRDRAEARGATSELARIETNIDQLNNCVVDLDFNARQDAIKKYRAMMRR